MRVNVAKPLSGGPVWALASWPRGGGCGRAAVLSIEEINEARLIFD
jgi:hypothetical protein